MANVFISHKSEDSSLAEEISRKIESSGHNVWFDGWEIDLGDSIVQKMNEGLTGASYLVLCYSNAGIEAPWISRTYPSNNRSSQRKEKAMSTKA